MDCRVARELIRQDVVPGRDTPRQRDLGFHLASCPTCRRLFELHQTRQAASALPQHNETAATNVSAGRGRVVWLGSLLLLLLAALLVVGTLSGVAWRTYANLTAITLPTPPAPPAATPSPLPTVPPVPTVVQAIVPLVTRVPTATPPRPVLPTPTVAPPEAGGPLTVLLLGSDGRPGQQAQPYTDAIMVVRLDPISGRAALLSLPRDLWVDIPGHGPQRLNQAYALGEQAAAGQGPVLAKATVAALLGIPVDAYAMLDFNGFVALVDALGGITINVERDLYDSQYPTMDYGYQEVYFAKGPTRMDGATALIYSRIRHSDSDFQRMERQHDVIAAIGRRLAERGLLRNLAQADAITAALRPYLRSDIPPQRMLGLLWALRDLDPASVPQLSVGPDMVRLGVGHDLYAQVPDVPALQALAAQLHE